MYLLFCGIMWSITAIVWFVEKQHAIGSIIFAFMAVICFIKGILQIRKNRNIKEDNYEKDN